MVRPTGRLPANRNRPGRRQNRGLTHVPYLSASTTRLIPHIRDDGGRDSVMREGPRWQIVVSPGVIRVQTGDLARAERTRERATDAHRHEIDMRVTYLANGEDVPEPLPTRGTIFAWSPESRARMIARLSDLDYNRLYGRYRICSDCGTDYPDHRFTCPACRPPGSSWSTAPTACRR